eukprot:4288859-Amphidinium_carterae.1
MEERAAVAEVLEDEEFDNDEVCFGGTATELLANRKPQNKLMDSNEIDKRVLLPKGGSEICLKS